MDTHLIARADRGDTVVPVGALLADVAEHTQAIVRTEVRLAVAQARAEVTEGVRRVSLIGAGGVLAVVSVVLLLIAGIFALSTVMVAWGAVLLAAGAAFLLSVALLVAARGART